MYNQWNCPLKPESRKSGMPGPVLSIFSFLPFKSGSPLPKIIKKINYVREFPSDSWPETRREVASPKLRDWVRTGKKIFLNLRDMGAWYLAPRKKRQPPKKHPWPFKTESPDPLFITQKKFQKLFENNLKSSDLLSSTVVCDAVLFTPHLLVTDINCLLLVPKEANNTWGLSSVSVSFVRKNWILC